MKKLLLLSLVLTMLLKASGQEGILDSSFGTNGSVELGNISGTAAFQSDGKLLIGQEVLTRYNTDGSIDSSYGINGTIIPKFGSRVRAYQQDGKLVVGGEEEVYTNLTIYHYFLFTRYNRFCRICSISLNFE